MKIAYTINGLIGGLSGKNFQLRDQELAPLIIKYTANSFKKFILSNNKDLDVFIFSWQPEFKDYFIEEYSPLVSCYTPQIKFEVPNYLPDEIRTQSHFSRWYGVKKLFDMIKVSGVNYDLILNCRMDTCWNRDICFDGWDLNKFHVAYHKTHPNYLPQDRNGFYMCDHFFGGNMDNFYKLSTLFYSLPQYADPRIHRCSYSHISNHRLCVQHLNATGLADISVPSIENVLDDGTGLADYNIFRYKKINAQSLEEAVKNELY